MQLLPIKRNVANPKTAGTAYKGIIYIYAAGAKRINLIPRDDVPEFRQDYFDNPVWYLQ